MGEDGPDLLCVPHVAVYPVIMEPPLLEGAVKVTETRASPTVPVPIVGEPGTVAGVTLFDAPDAALSPTLLVASTVHVTATPFVSPLTKMGEDEPELLCVPHVAV